MGGLPCAKEILDNYNLLRQRVSTTLAVLYRALDCMGASIQLGAVLGKTPTDDQEAEFFAATDSLCEELQLQADELAKLAASIQETVEVT